jgi:hypothetical protein
MGKDGATHRDLGPTLFRDAIEFGITLGRVRGDDRPGCSSEGGVKMGKTISRAARRLRFREAAKKVRCSTVEEIRGLDAVVGDGLDRDSDVRSLPLPSRAR